MRVIKNLESFETVKVVNQNEEFAITSDTAHGFKDGDKVRFYITNLSSFSVWIVFLLWILAEIEEEIYETKYNIFNV